MHLKINLVFFVCSGNMAILASVGKNCSNTEKQDTNTKKLATSDSTVKSVVTKTDVNDFATIRYQPDFIDQSLLIENVSTVYGLKLLLAPRRSGKSVNISMLKRFFELPPDEATLRANRKLFEGLKIEKHESTLKEHFGDYPVLFLDFKKVRPVNSYNDTLELFRDILHRAYKSHAYLRTSDKLKDEEKSDIEEWLGNRKYHTFRSKEKHIYCGFQRLTEYIFKHFGWKIFLLVDEYDSLWSDYVNKDSKMMKEYISLEDHSKVKDIAIFYSGLLESLTVHNENIGRAILTGIYSLQPISYTWQDGSDLKFIWGYDCRRHPICSKFFGNYSKGTSK